MQHLQDRPIASQHDQWFTRLGQLRLGETMISADEPARPVIQMELDLAFLEFPYQDLHQLARTGLGVVGNQTEMTGLAHARLVGLAATRGKRSSALRHAAVGAGDCANPLWLRA
jgi:hypothetical protein